MKESVKLSVGGVKCDNEGCDYTDKNVSVDDFSEWIDRPCPKCGSNLLTKKDYDSLIEMSDAVSVLSKLFSGISDDNSGDAVVIPLKMDGSGEIKFDV